MVSAYSRWIACLAAVVLLNVAASANAGILLGQPNTINFQNREIVDDADGDFSISAGDRIFGILYANSIDSTPPQPTVSPELTGVFDLRVVHVIALEADAGLGISVGDSIDPTAGGGYSGEALVLFNPTGAGGILAGATAGTALQLWEGGADTIAALNAPGSDPTATIAAASDGTFIGDFGFDSLGVTPADWGAAGVGYWGAQVFYDGGISEDGASIYYGLNYLAGPVGAFGMNGLQNSALTGSVRNDFDDAGTMVSDNRIGGSTVFDFVGKAAQEFNDAAGLSAGTTAADRAKFPLYSNDPAALHPNVPEPGSMILALIGAGCAIPVVRRRRKNREQVA